MGRRAEAKLEQEQAGAGRARMRGMQVLHSSALPSGIGPGWGLCNSLFTNALPVTYSLPPPLYSAPMVMMPLTTTPVYVRAYIFFKKTA